MRVFIVTYIIIGVLSFFYGNITPELESLGTRPEIISIVGDGLDASVKGAGLVGASLLGITNLPTLPKKKDDVV